MASRHLLRIASQLKFLISTVLQRDLHDPRLGFITVISVEPTEDYKEAKVTVSILGSTGERSRTLRALEDARGFIQRKIGKHLHLRHTPQLRFVIDEEQERWEHLDDLIARTKEDEEPGGPEHSPPEE